MILQYFAGYGKSWGILKFRGLAFAVMYNSGVLGHVSILAPIDNTERFKTIQDDLAASLIIDVSYLVRVLLRGYQCAPIVSPRRGIIGLAVCDRYRL